MKKLKLKKNNTAIILAIIFLGIMGIIAIGEGHLFLVLCILASILILIRVSHE